MKPDPLTLRDFAERYTDAWCSQDPAGVAAFFSPRASLTVNGGPPATGRDEITAVARSFMTAFPDLKVVMDDLRIERDSIEYHWTLAGTNTGGTGKKVRIRGFEEWQIGADGLIASSLGHFDEAEYQRQLQHGVECIASPDPSTPGVKTLP